MTVAHAVELGSCSTSNDIMQLACATGSYRWSGAIGLKSLILKRKPFS